MEMGNVQSPAGSQYTPTVLIVEDDIHNQEMIGYQLSQAGISSAGVVSGEMGLAWLEDNTADLVILDWLLPEMNGLEVCQSIRQNHKEIRLPILMVSALGDNAHVRVEGLRAGANDFLAKPFHTQELITRTQNLLKLAKHTANSKCSPTRFGLKPDNDIHSRLRHFSNVTILVMRLIGQGYDQNPQASILELDTFFRHSSEIIEAYNGTVVDFTKNRIVTMFPASVGTESTPFLATSAALELRSLFPTLWEQSIHTPLAIGIHHGEMTVGVFGNSHTPRTIVLGNDVDIAEYLAAAAEGNAILMSDSVVNGFDIAAPFEVDHQHQLLGVCNKSIMEVYALAQSYEVLHDNAIARRQKVG